LVLCSEIHTAIWPIIEKKHDAIHKTEVLNLSEKDGATVMGNMHKN